MKIRWRPVVYAVGGVLAVLVAAAVALPFLIDVNRFKPQIVALVKDATGRDLVIDKDLVFSPLPRPSIRIAGLRFRNAAWGSRPDMLSVGEASLSVDLLPLLRGTLKIGEVRLADVDVLLETDKAGHGNWQFGAAKPVDNGGGALVLPDVADVAVKAIKVAFRNGMTGRIDTLDVKSLSALAGASGAVALKAEASVNSSPVTLAGTLGSLADLAANRSWPLKLDLAAGGAKLAVDGAVARPTELKGLNFALRVEGSDLALLGPLAGAPLSKSKPYRLAMQVKGEPAALNLSGLVASLGNNAVAGDLILNLLGARPKVAGNLNLARLDPSDFPQGEAKPAAKRDGRVIPDMPLDFSGLRLIDLDLNISAPALAMGAFTLADLATRLVVTDGELALRPLTLAAFDGKASGELTLSAKNNAMAIKLTLRRFAMGKLLAAAGAPAGLLDGPADYDLDVRGAGGNLRALLASLNGQTALVMDSGKVGAKYEDYLSADLFKILIPGAKKADAKLNCFVGRYDIRAGVVETTGFLFDSESSTIQGEGRANFGTEALDVVFKPRPKDASLLSVAVPVKVGGTFASPSIRPDEFAVAKGVGGAVLGGVFNPLGILIPLVTGGDRTNPCLAALAKPAPAGARATAPQRPADGGVGGFFRGLGQTLDKSLGR